MRRRRGWDAQPATRCDVLLASDGRREFSSAAVARAAELAGRSGSVAAVVVAKIYGSSFGLPHPGLMPTRQELDERQRWLETALAELRRRGVQADGQIAATRRATKKLAAIAALREPRTVVIDESTATGLRRLIEGDVGAELRKKLRSAGIEVEVVPALRA